MKYFVSYTTRDSSITKDVLITLSDKIRKRVDIYIDILDNDSEDKQERVIRELENSSKVILIETDNVYKSEWVTFEISKAKELNIPVVILLINDIITLCGDELFLKINIDSWMNQILYIHYIIKVYSGNINDTIPFISFVTNKEIYKTMKGNHIDILPIKLRWKVVYIKCIQIAYL